MSLGFTIKPLAEADKGFCISSWREGNKAAPENHRVPWRYYKATTGAEIAKLVNDPSTKILAAYAADTNKLLGWIAMTPGKRVSAVHWVYVKHTLDGDLLRRRGIAAALLEAADLGARFIYTMRGRRTSDLLADGSKAKSLDVVLAEAMTRRENAIHATFVPLKDFLS